MDDFQRAMRGSFLAGSAGADGERDADGEYETRPGTGVSAERARGVSPEKTSSPAFLPSDAGRSGAEAAERRDAARVRTA
ncbi:MAG: hypothetical protein PHS14_05585 [Elusimicrobia bacterium]|nr:hypothetical protein [Elusimicrobiota bacterium]